MNRPALADIDLANLDIFERNEAWSSFDRLRAEAPVHWNPEPDGAGFWSITKHEDIVAIDRDAETFTSTDYVNLEEVDDDLKDLRRSILESDGTRHRALRKLLQRDFGGQTLKKFEDFLQGLTEATVNAALRQGTFDFVKEVSADFPIQVLAQMLDVPADRTDQLIHWGNQIIGNTDPDYADGAALGRRQRPVQAPAVPLPRRRSRCSSTDASWPSSAVAATARTSSASWSTGYRSTANR